MASSSLPALRRATTLLCRLRAAPVAASAVRGFNTDSQMMTTPSDDDDRRVEVQRRPDSSVSRGRRDSFPSFFSDAFDPFSPTRSVRQMLNIMDQFMDAPFMSQGRDGLGLRRGWDVREDDNALHLRVDMPGLDKDQVKVSVEQNTLLIRGEGEKESEDEEEQEYSRRRFSSRLDLPSSLYKLDGIKAEMKNGVLKIMVPKVKEEDRKDVFEVSVE